jgi:hypothetical protein
MQSINEMIRKVLPLRKEVTVRVVVDVAESYKQLFAAVEKLKDKDIDRIGNTFERVFKLVDKRISK